MFKNKVYPNQMEDSSCCQAEGTCRICLQQSKELIRPCECTGTIQYVHENCMKEWLLSKIRHSSRKQKQYCQICQTEIHFVSDMQVEIKCQSADCKKIHSCFFVGLFVGITINVILGVLLSFSQEMFSSNAGQTIMIVSIILVSFCIVLAIVGIIYNACSVKKLQIKKVLTIQEWRARESSRPSMRTIQSRSLHSVGLSSDIQSVLGGRGTLMHH